MSLNYDLKKVHDYQALMVKLVDTEMGGQRYANADDDPKDVYEAVNFVTRDIIFLTMPLAIGEITEKNWMEFYHRLCLYEMYHGQIWKDIRLGPDIVKRHIGLKTNVYTDVKAWNRLVKKWRAQFDAAAVKAADGLPAWEFKRAPKA